MQVNEPGYWLYLVSSCQLRTSDIGVVPLLSTFTIFLPAWKKVEVTETSYTPYLEINDSVYSIFEYLRTLPEVVSYITSLQPATLLKVNSFAVRFSSLHVRLKNMSRFFRRFNNSYNSTQCSSIKILFKEISDYQRHYSFTTTLFIHSFMHGRVRIRG